MKKVKFYLIILVCVFCVPLRSQNVDSLWKVYHNKIQVDTNRLKALDAIINIYRDNNPDTTILLAKQAIGFANEVGLDDDSYYDAFLLIFEQALKLLMTMPEASRQQFLDRLDVVRKSNQNISGWVAGECDEFWLRKGL